MRTITIVLVNVDGTQDEREVSLEVVMDAGTLVLPDDTYADEALSIANGRFYRFSRLDGKFFNRPVFEETKLGVIQ